MLAATGILGVLLAIVSIVVVLLVFGAIVTAILGPSVWAGVKALEGQKETARRFQELDRYYDAYTHTWRMKDGGRGTPTTKPPPPGSPPHS